MQLNYWWRYLEPHCKLLHINTCMQGWEWPVRPAPNQCHLASSHLNRSPRKRSKKNDKIMWSLGKVRDVAQIRIRVSDTIRIGYADTQFAKKNSDTGYS
jgi:hypothetical protein